ncbi:hypothetical protein [Mycobacterium sp. ITM-2016-00318]|uniref:hypothetical protein n=1 Tax=Mycobacterium sp. ITM-2016-00318 TaxID=2099693 RepID=UPI0013049CA3|nr:hypothetical protein [Mycobacterium sp. ITM-2016-00318]WNG95294.1 hypothetical protein C6A82_013180 [Mycobacterium sp. ITM-2016-00318]
MTPEILVNLTFLFGVFAIGTAFGDLLKDSGTPNIRNIGRAIKFNTGVLTGMFGMLGALSSGFREGWVLILFGVLILVMVWLVWRFLDARAEERDGSM